MRPGDEANTGWVSLEHNGEDLTSRMVRAMQGCNPSENRFRRYLDLDETTDITRVDRPFSSVSGPIRLNLYVTFYE